MFTISEDAKEATIELEECVVLVWNDLRLLIGLMQMEMELARKFLECQDIKKVVPEMYRACNILYNAEAW